MARSTFETVADRVRRFPRAAARAAMAAMTAAASTVSTSSAPVTRRQRCEREVPSNSRYFLRSSRRQA